MHGVALAGAGLHRADRAERGHQQRQRVRADVPQRAVLLPPGRVSNGEPASEPSQVTEPPASVVRAACSSQVEVAVRKRLVKKTTEATPAAATASTTRSAAASRQRDRLLQQQVLAGGGRALGERGLHVRRQREADRVDVGEQRVDVVGARRRRTRAPTAFALARSRPQTPTSSASGCAASDVACTSLGPEAGAQHAEAHGQTAPNWRSPASPSPGTM